MGKQNIASHGTEVEVVEREEDDVVEFEVDERLEEEVVEALELDLDVVDVEVAAVVAVVATEVVDIVETDDGVVDDVTGYEIWPGLVSGGSSRYPPSSIRIGKVPKTRSQGESGV